MNDRHLEHEIRELAATIDDPAEAAALVELFTLAAAIDLPSDADDDYTPFVYPH